MSAKLALTIRIAAQQASRKPMIHREPRSSEDPRPGAYLPGRDLWLSVTFVRTYSSQQRDA